MIESRAVTQFPLRDQEILLRHLHKTARKYVADYRRRRRPWVSEESDDRLIPPDFADLEPFSQWCLASEAERYAKRLSSSMEEMHAFYGAAFPRLEAALGYLDSLDLGSLPEDAGRLLLLCYSLVNVSFPVEVWRQARVPDSGAASMDAVVEPAV